MIYKIPTWDNGNWTYTTFPDKESFREFVKSLFKEPGKYQFDETTYEWNSRARNFNKHRCYTDAPEDSRDYIEYWDTEKEKCRKGVIYKHGTNVWYLPRFYYHWLNFLQIFNKSVDNFTFPEVRDVQYHMALYEILAALHGEDASTLKARQKASSYFHLCKMYNKYIFEKGYVGKVMASNKDFMIQPNGSWKFLDHYHNFTNENTAWACTNMPDKPLEWQQKVETKTPDGRKVKIGTMATIVGITLNQSPTAGVGGSCSEAFYEEGGIAPTADETHIYMKSAMREGDIVSGIFSIAGSVGKLTDCGPLKEFTLNPTGHGFYAVWTNLLDKNGAEGWTGLFIPEQWGMPPFIDKFGNSMIEEALAHLEKQDSEWKNGYTNDRGQKVPPMKAELYQIERSQHPRNIEEAFAIRTISIFPVKHTSRQIKRIEDNQYYLKYVDLERTDENKIITKPSERKPNEYPIVMTTEDKRGCVVTHEHPGQNPECGPNSIYYYSVDPVETGDTTSSDSLAAIYIYKNPIEVTRIDAEGNSETFIEGDKLVAEWVGRYDDVNETNEYMSMLVEYYNAWGISERNKPSFNTHMILKKRTRHLAPEKEMLFDSEIEPTQNTTPKYGWFNTTNSWRKILQYGVDYLSEELKPIEGTDGKITLRYGVERIPFTWLLREMQQYQPKKNFDRIISYCALIAFAKIQQAALGTKKRIERHETKSVKQKSHTFTKGMVLRSIGQLNTSANRRPGNPFRSIGR